MITKTDAIDYITFEGFTITGVRAFRVKSCITCEHFEEHAGERCSLAATRPPARVIAQGCEQYRESIPF